MKGSSVSIVTAANSWDRESGVGLAWRGLGVVEGVGGGGGRRTEGVVVNSGGGSVVRAPDT